MSYINGKTFRPRFSFFLFLTSPCYIFILNFFRDISRIMASSSLINQLSPVRKRMLNLNKRNVIKVTTEKLGSHSEGNVMNKTYKQHINDKV